MTAVEAAEWMLKRYRSFGFLYQEDAATHLLHLHDKALAYYDAQGNVCVGKEVLKEFNRRTPDAIYERADKFWRARLPSDQPGRQQ